MSTSVSAFGRELIEAWHFIDRGLADWILKLADFDASGEWAEDGFASCASWLADRCSIGHSTAHEKLKVAHELARRPAVREAFADGRLPYSKARLLVRLEGVDHERDEQFVGFAMDDSVRVVQNRVQNWNYFNGQDKRPTNIDDRYGIHRQRGFGNGLGRAVIEAPDDMLDRLFALLAAYGDYLFHQGEQPPQLGLLQPVNEAAMQTPPDAEPSAERRSSSAKRLDYLFDLLEEVALSAPEKLDPYKAAVGVTVQYEDLVRATGHGLSSQESLLTPDAIHRLMCDAGIHRIVVRGQSEIVDLGRDERLFNRKQRRAIRFRHGHVCAVRGCGRRITHIHHLNWWEHGGETNIDNGVPLCSYHHHLVHEGGWKVTWNPATGVTRLEGPLGQVLETEAHFGRRAA